MQSTRIVRLAQVWVKQTPFDLHHTQEQQQSFFNGTSERRKKQKKFTYLASHPITPAKPPRAHITNYIQSSRSKNLAKNCWTVEQKKLYCFECVSRSRGLSVNTHHIIHVETEQIL